MKIDKAIELLSELKKLKRVFGNADVRIVDEKTVEVIAGNYEITLKVK